jgi:hypothetical protein
MSDHCRARTIPVTGSTAADELAALREGLRALVAEWRAMGDQCVRDSEFNGSGQFFAGRNLQRKADEIEALLPPSRGPQGITQQEIGVLEAAADMLDPPDGAQPKLTLAEIDRRLREITRGHHE